MSTTTTISLTRPAWLPAYAPLPDETFTLHRGDTDDATPTASITTTQDSSRTTNSLPSGLATNFIGDSGIPLWIPPPPPAANATANAASAAVLGMEAGGGQHVGSLGMLTVMLMLYNVAAGLGLGVLLWKGIIDWKGNVVNRIMTAAGGDAGNELELETMVRVVDSTGTQWYIPAQTLRERAAGSI